MIRPLTAIPALLAVSSSVLAIGVLLLRKVPDSLSSAVHTAAVQPLLADDTRATYLSVQNLVGKLLFAGSLWVSSMFTSHAGQMPLDDVQNILGWYAGAGLVLLLVLFVAARGLRLEDTSH